MTDVQSAPLAIAQPSVFDASPSLSQAAVLTRPSGTALHVERDTAYILAVRDLRGTCTRDEWDRPEYRRRAISRMWVEAAGALRSEDEELISWCPVTLYRDRATNVVVCADISLPGKPAKLVTAKGQPALASLAELALTYRVERTTFAQWALGPLPHFDLTMRAATTPDDDRDIQYLRNQNRALRDLIDASLAPAEWAPEANTLTPDDDDGLVDFVIRGVIRRRDLKRFDSKQGAGVSGIVLDGRLVHAEEFEAPSDETSLDAILEAE